MARGTSPLADRVGTAIFAPNIDIVDEPHIDAASLAAIACPVTVMAGEFDCIVPEETRLIAASIPAAKVWRLFQTSFHFGYKP